MAKAKKTTKAKELIKIKFKKLANGNQSIFLEKYIGYKKETMTRKTKSFGMISRIIFEGSGTAML